MINRQNELHWSIFVWQLELIDFLSNCTKTRMKNCLMKTFSKSFHLRKTIQCLESNRQMFFELRRVFEFFRTIAFMNGPLECLNKRPTTFTLAIFQFLFASFAPFTSRFQELPLHQLKTSQFRRLQKCLLKSR